MNILGSIKSLLFPDINGKDESEHGEEDDEDEQGELFKTDFSHLKDSEFECSDDLKLMLLEISKSDGFQLIVKRTRRVGNNKDGKVSLKI